MRNRGMVLMAVLWMVFILSIVSFSLASAVRMEVQAATDSFESEKAAFMAMGAAQVVYDYISRQQQIPQDSAIRLDGRDYVFPFEAGEARVRLESATGRVDLNAASDALLAAAIDSTGVSEADRNRVLDSIRDWQDADDVPHLYGAEAQDYGTDIRPRNAAFESVDELLMVRHVTPEMFHGALIVDGVNGYRKTAGLRDLLTVDSGRDGVNSNEAGADVLRILPGVTEDIATRIVEERNRERFAGRDALAARIPAMAGHESLAFMTFEERPPAIIVATASLADSAVSRTVRLLFRRERKIEVLSAVPPVAWRWVDAIEFDRWQF